MELDSILFSCVSGISLSNGQESNNTVAGKFDSLINLLYNLG